MKFRTIRAFVSIWCIVAVQIRLVCCLQHQNFWNVGVNRSLNELSKSKKAIRNSHFLLQNRLKNKVFLTIGSVEDDLGTEIPFSSDKFIHRNEEEANMNELTNKLLDREKFPPGSLSIEVLSSIHFVMDKWAKSGKGEEGAILVQNILNRVIEEQDAGNPLAEDFVSTKLYTAAIDAWARSKSPNAPANALLLLDEVCQAHKDTNNNLLKPNAISYNAVINSFSKAGYAKEAENLLDRMTKFDDLDIQPNSVTYNAVLDAYARSAQYDHKSAEKAEQILHRMRLSSNSANTIKPDIISFNTVIDAYAKTGNPEKAEEILKEMKNDGVIPDEVTHSSVIQAWARSGSPESADRALTILKQMEFDGRNCEAKIQLDLMSWNAVLDCLAKNGKALDAENLLKRMEIENAHPNTISYNTVINSISKSGERHAAEHALKILERMEKMHDNQHNPNVKPDVISYTSVINAFSQSKKPDAPQKAEALLEKMVQKSRNGDENVFPNTVTINSVISAYAKSKEKGAAQRAERILTRMEDLYHDGDDRLKPNAISYTSVIDCYAKSKEKGSCERAHAIFKRMEESYKSGNLDAKPNVHSYNTLLNAIARQNSAEAVENAEAILNEMEEKFRKEGCQDARPNVVSYTTIMTAIVRSGTKDAAERAEQLLNRMEEMYANGNTSANPNAYSYSVVIGAHIKSGGASGVLKAQQVLERMVAAYRSGNSSAKPNLINYTALIDAWSKSGETRCGEKADEILQQMEDMYIEFGNDSSFKPNLLSFNACINAWAKSRSFEKGQRAKDILSRMVQLYKDGDANVKPNVFTFTSVLNACAYTSGDLSIKQRALLIAADTYKQLATPPNEFGKPNHVTYATFLKACHNLIPAGTDARASSVETVFRKCCEDGQVNDLVLRELKAAVVSRDQLKKLLGAISENAKWSDLPKEWTKNVKEIDRKHRSHIGISIVASYCLCDL